MNLFDKKVELVKSDPRFTGTDEQAKNVVRTVYPTLTEESFSNNDNKGNDSLV